MPHVDRECVTHHYACRCREARSERMEKLLREVLERGLMMAFDKGDIAKAEELRARIEREVQDEM